MELRTEKENIANCRTSSPTLRLCSIEALYPWARPANKIKHEPNAVKQRRVPIFAPFFCFIINSAIRGSP